MKCRRCSEYVGDWVPEQKRGPEPRYYVNAFGYEVLCPGCFEDMSSRPVYPGP